MKSQWHKLLSFWQNQAQRHALTFPFLLGADRNPIGKAFESEVCAKQSLDELLSAICIHTLESGYLYVYRCPDRDKLVLRHVNNNPHSLLIAVKTSPESPGTLFVAPEEISGTSPNTYAELFAALWRECGAAVISGHFSCRGKTFDLYNDYELKIIKSALK